MTASRTERVRDILAAINASPDPDGEKTFPLSLPPIVLFVRVEQDYTIYYSVTWYPATKRREIKVYDIKETVGSITLGTGPQG